MTGERRIAILPDAIVARIAAGEVVERPSSVVRELLDNAIDAGARRITVEIEEGGIALIRVTDDGHGIAPGDIDVAFERHATSKLDPAAGLEAIVTLGFRGEALPSIAAAGDLELTTRHREEPVAVHLQLEDGRTVRRTSKPAPVGTTVALRALFGRLPARRKFLGAPGGETRHVTTLVSHYALAYPGVAFVLQASGKRSFATPGDGRLRNAFGAVYGHDVAAEMLEVDHTENGIAVRGLAGPPSVHRGNRTAISVFINGRWVQSRALVFAAADAYRAQLPVGRHPIVCLAVEIDRAEVDVNVHPAKAEVRFQDERAVGSAVRHGVVAALEGSAPVHASDSVFTGTNAPELVDPPPAPGLRDRLAAPGRVSPPEPPRALGEPQPWQSRLDLSARPAPPVGDERPTQREVLPLLRVVGQMAATYVVAEGPDGMYLVDQHAAHERVLYDRIVGAKGDDGARQPLLEPLLIELDLHQAATLEAYREALAATGLGLEEFGERAVLLRAVPLALAGREIGARVCGVLDRLGSDGRAPDRFDHAAATVACHGSVRAGATLAIEEMRALIRDLEGSEAPRTCPHGRPTLVHVATETLERQFRRR